MVRRSEFSLAIIFGVISPKIRTITVETAIETAPLAAGLVGKTDSKMLLNNTERVMFTELNAVSVAEKKAENSTKTTMSIMLKVIFSGSGSGSGDCIILLFILFGL